MTASRCLWCSPRWEGGPFVICEACQALYRERSATMCRSCDRAASPGSIYCEKHRLDRNGRASRARDGRRGRCLDCGGPLSPRNKRYCEQHRLRHVAACKKNRENAAKRAAS